MRFIIFSTVNSGRLLDNDIFLYAAAIEEGRKLAYDKTATGYTNMDDLKAALAL